jgi:hypothetical protein
MSKHQLEDFVRIDSGTRYGDYRRERVKMERETEREITDRVVHLLLKIF